MFARKPIFPFATIKTTNNDSNIAHSLVLFFWFFFLLHTRIAGAFSQVNGKHANETNESITWKTRTVPEICVDKWTWASGSKCTYWCETMCVCLWKQHSLTCTCTDLNVDDIFFVFAHWKIWKVWCYMLGDCIHLLCVFDTFGWLHFPRRGRRSIPFCGASNFL